MSESAEQTGRRREILGEYLLCCEEIGRTKGTWDVMLQVVLDLRAMYEEMRERMVLEATKEER